MPEHLEVAYFLRDLFPRADAELLRLFEGAADNASLLRSDYYTIRDWLELADYRDHATLPALLLILLLALEEGSFCVACTEPALARRLTDVVGADEAQAWARRILAELERDPCARLIGTSPRESRPIILHTIGQQKFLYFQKYLKAELQFHQQLRARLDAAPPLFDASRLRETLREVLVDEPLLLPDGEALQLDPEQHWALGAALAGNQAIISGGPGTGKTSIVLTLLRCLVRQGFAPERIALAAPTGRAAQRLTDALRLGHDRLPSARVETSPDFRLRELTASTLHQLLGYRPNRNLFTRHPENPIPADVVVVDEVSMVGLVMMAQLFSALAPRTRLILLGDKDQLPSVDAGAVLGNLVGDRRPTVFTPTLCDQLAGAWPEIAWPRSEAADRPLDHVVVLRTNHRSQSEIRAVAQAINTLDADVVDRLPSLHFPPEATSDVWWTDLERAGGCWLLQQTHATPTEVRGFLQHWIEHAYFRSRAIGPTLAELVRSLEDGDVTEERLGQLFELVDRFRLLTLVREGPWGCVDINRFCDQVLRPRLDPDARTGLFAGAPVLIVRNDATHGLFNGDVGMALRQRGQLRVVFPRQDGFLWFPADALPAHELGFALTVHKSQGSEYAHVLVVLPPEGGRRLLTKELLYTAVTRAKSLAILCGTKEALRFAINRRIERESGLLSSAAGGLSLAHSPATLPRAPGAPG